MMIIKKKKKKKKNNNNNNDSLRSWRLFWCVFLLSVCLIFFFVLGSAFTWLYLLLCESQMKKHIRKMPATQTITMILINSQLKTSNNLLTS